MRPQRLIANRDFARLFTAQVVSLVGSGMTSVALAAFAYELTGRDATVVIGTALMLRILAFVVLAPIAGVVADRVDRKRLLIGADLVRVALLALFPFIATEYQIYALIFAINAATAFFSPTFEAALPDVVGRRLYTRAISLSRVALALQAAAGGGSCVVALLLPRTAEAVRRGTKGPRNEHLRYHRWANRTMMAGGVLLTVSLLPGALAPGLVLLTILWMVKGAGQIMVTIPAVGLLAEHTLPEERGKAYAAPQRVRGMPAHRAASK